MTRFERLVRTRGGTVLYAVIRTPTDYRVVEWDPAAETLTELVRYEWGPVVGRPQGRPQDARQLAIEMAEARAAH